MGGRQTMEQEAGDVMSRTVNDGVKKCAGSKYCSKTSLKVCSLSVGWSCCSPQPPSLFLG